METRLDPDISFRGFGGDFWTTAQYGFHKTDNWTSTVKLAQAGSSCSQLWVLSLEPYNFED